MDDINSKKQPLIIKEVSGAIKRVDLAFYIAWSDTKTRYRRSVLGPFWLVLGTLIGVGGLGVVWSTLFQVDDNFFIPSLTIGLVTWYLLSAVITEGSEVFHSNRELIRNIAVSSILVSVLLLFRHLINFVHNLAVVVVVMVIYPQHLSWNAILFLPGLALVSINLLGIIQLVGYIGSRYRDLSPLLVAIMQPMFFITPVLFRPEQLGGVSIITELNPLTYLLSLIRDPLMGTPAPLSTWLIVTGMTIAIWTLSLLMIASKRHRLPYWVN